jgi:DNA-binding MurR/RpiR family transcriptional regulator
MVERRGAVSATHPPPDILSRILDGREAMSRGERRVAEVVIGDIEFAVHAPTNDIAARAGVSPPTVTRFCRTVGCGGLRELKLDLAKTLSVGTRYLHNLDGRERTSETVSAIVSLIHDTLDALASQISGETLLRVARAMHGAKRVLIFGGGGGSSMAAMEAENRLFRLGVYASHCNDSQLQMMMAATLKKGDVLLLLSISGRYDPLVQAAEVAAHYGARTIAITAPKTPLAAAASDLIPFVVSEPEDILMPTPARYALLMLIDMLAFNVAVLRKDAASESLRRIKYQLVTMRDKDDSQPLGD